MPVPAIDTGVMRRRVARMRRLADVRLRAIASRLEKEDAELSHRIRDLARCPLLGGVSEDSRAEVASIAERINELSGAAIFDAETFADGMETGDFRPFTEELATGFEVLPNAVNKVWHGRELDQEDLDAIAAATGTTEPSTWWITFLSITTLINDMIAVFVDRTEEHRYTCGPVEVTTLSMLETRFTGLESGANKQPFSAKYVVQFAGDMSEAVVVFDCRLLGSRLSKIDYPISAQATMANGATLALTPMLVADTDYNEVHKLAIGSNPRSVEISVNGTAHWADWLGHLTSIGSVPHGCVRERGNEHPFGSKDSIWTYGWSK